MQLSSRKSLLLGLMATILIVTGIVIYIQNPSIFTTNLDTRPFNIGVAEPLDTLEPALLDFDSQQLVASCIYEGLVTYNDKTKEVEPLLAKSWKYSADGKTITFHLRKDVKFSNGKQLTALDVKSSWENNFSTSKEWTNASMLMPIAGANDKLQGKTANISGLQPVDEYTLKIELTGPNASFLNSLVNPMFWVNDTAKGAESIGTGPYILKEHNKTSATLLRNENYYRGLPHLSAINVTCYTDLNEALQAYKGGKIDYLNDVPVNDIPGIKENEQYKKLFIEKPTWEVYWLCFNLTREPYADNYLLRRAINYAIDREAIIKNILGGGYLPSKGVLPADITGYNKSMTGYTYNPEKAKQLLAEAGYPEGQGLKPLTLTLNRDAGHSMVASEVVRQLGTIGIAVQLQEDDWDYYKKQIYQRGISFFRLSWEADYPDPDNFLYTLFHSSKIGISNLTGYNNPQVDKMLDASRAEYRDPEARLKYLQKAEQMIIDDAPCVWLFQRKANDLVGKDVRGLNVNSINGIDWYKVELVRPEVEPSKPAPTETKTGE